MDKIDITTLTNSEKQALVCLFFARIPNTDPRYKKRIEYWKVLESSYNKKVNTYKNDKDALDAFFSTNGRKGWQYKDLGKRNKDLKTIYEKFADADDVELEKAVDEIIANCKAEDKSASYIALRLQKPEQVHSLIDENNTDGKFSIDGIYTLQEKFTLNRIVFVALGGDKGQSSVDWHKGFYGLAKVIREPYDIGYVTANRGTPYYKVDLQMLWKHYPPITKDELMKYPDTFDASYIGLEIHRDPTQAVAQLEDNKAIAIVRAALDKAPDALDRFKNIFSQQFMERVTGFVRRLVSIDVDYGQSLKEALVEKINVIDKQDNIYETERETGGVNILYYGIPGSGKSHKIDQVAPNDGCRMRVIFHPEYTYSDFVGQIQPVLDGENIKYKFVPGPFAEILHKAYYNSAQMHYFVIEELNRGNAAAIFGDAFQLLDRDYDGTSKYGIKNSSVAEFVYGDKDHEIKIPSNLTIYATMNTSDQNVFTLDTAFQRRWEMEHVPNEFDNKIHKEHVLTEIEDGVTWYAFATTVNETVVNTTMGYGMSEDKQLGLYFATNKDFQKKKFAEKVLKYLWDDAVKMNRSTIFNTDKAKTFEAVVKTYDKEGLKGVLIDSLYNAIKACPIPSYPEE